MSADQHESLEGLLTQIDREVGQCVPGLALVAVTGDEALVCEGYGAMALVPRLPMTSDTICNWFSMTKLATATAVVQLADAGRLDLDAPVSHHYEPFEMTRPDARSRVATVRHLLSHSSGLANPMPLRWVHLATESGPDRPEFVRGILAKHRRLRFDPGTRAAYSNLGYLVLGEIIEAVSGNTFEHQIRHQILEPLGMNHTGFTADPANQWATPHQLRRSAIGALLPILVPRKIIGPTVDRFRTLRPFYVDGAAYGGLVGPATDAARFLQAHLSNGTLHGTRILSPEATQSMQRITAAGKRFQVGLGWFRRGRHPNTAFLEHLGGGAGFWNCMRIYPDLGIGVVTMGNATSYDHDAIAQAAINTFSQ